MMRGLAADGGFRNAVSATLAAARSVSASSMAIRTTPRFTNGITATQTLSMAPQVYYANIIDNYIAGPYRYGIQAYGSGIEIRGNRIYDVGGQSGSFAMGIRVAGPTGAGMPRFFLLKDNLVAGTNAGSNVAYGIYSDNSVAAIIINNGVSGTTGAWGSPGPISKAGRLKPTARREA
jgi:hypothetical protein